jgi:hypothetical protein
VTPLETGILSVVGVAVLAFVMKMVTAPPKDEGGGGSGGADPSSVDDAQIDDLLDEVSESSLDVVAITSDGWGFVPRGEDVLLFPPRDSEDVLHMPGGESPIPRDRDTLRQLLALRPEFTLEPGDLIAVRVVRGAPGFDPWRLEALGRDSEYRAWFFEAPNAANAALDLLKANTVQPPLDEDGEPREVPDSEFEAARQRDEETERALDDPDE